MTGFYPTNLKHPEYLVIGWPEHRRMTGFCPTILKCPELGDLMLIYMYVTEQVHPSRGPTLLVLPDRLHDGGSAPPHIQPGTRDTGSYFVHQGEPQR